MNGKRIVILTALTAIAVFAASAWWVSRPIAFANIAAVPPEISKQLVRAYSPVLGPVSAPVTIVEFFDPACEGCRAFYPIVKDIMAQYPDDVRVILRYTPFHGDASEQAIRVLEAARIQNVYLPVLEALLDNQAVWTRPDAPAAERIMQISGEAGLDVALARMQIQMPDIVAIANQDRLDVAAVGIRQTPTFFVNSKPLATFGEAQLRALVAAEVKAVGQS